MATTQTTLTAVRTAGAQIVQQVLDLEFNHKLTPSNVKNAMADIGAGKRDFYMGSPASLTILETFNVRVKNKKWHDRVRAIANSMKREGFKHDKAISVIAVTKDGKTLVHPYDGHTRLASLELANSELKAEGKPTIDIIPLKPAPMGTTLEDITTNLVTGNMGEPLSPFEVAIVCKRKVTYGQQVEDIAADFSLTVPYVNDLLMLMGSPKEIRDMVQSDQVATTDAIMALKNHKDRALEFLEAMLARAKNAGKSRATAQFAPGYIYNRAVKSSAPAMATAVKEIQKDPGFAGLSTENQKKLTDLFAILSKAEEEEGKAALAANPAQADLVALAA